MIDVASMTDIELEEARIAVAAERSRRTALASIPNQIAALKTQYAEQGGDVTTLVDILQPAPATTATVTP